MQRSSDTITTEIRDHSNDSRKGAEAPQGQRKWKTMTQQVPKVVYLILTAALTVIVTTQLKGPLPTIPEVSAMIAKESDAANETHEIRFTAIDARLERLVTVVDALAEHQHSMLAAQAQVVGKLDTFIELSKARENP